MQTLTELHLRLLPPLRRRCIIDHNNRWRSNSNIFLGVFSLLLPEETADGGEALCKPLVDNQEWSTNNARNSCEPRIGEESNQHSPRNANKASDDRNRPLCAIKAIGVNLESPAANEDDHNLQANDHNDDESEGVVEVYTLKDVELVI